MAQGKYTTRHSDNRYKDLRTEMLCGRKVWTCRRNSGLPEIWVHASPSSEPLIYVRGSSLLEGTEQDNIEYLETLVAEKISSLRPISAKTEQLWDADRVSERQSWDDYYASGWARLPESAPNVPED